MPRKPDKRSRANRKLDPNRISGISAAAAKGALEGQREARPAPDAVVDPRSPKVTGGTNVENADRAQNERE